MKATVIIPTYSPGEYIYECLNSIIKQTLPTAEFETIIILNGPKEPYYSKLRGYISSHRNCNIQLIYTEALGVSNARNIGIDNAKGDYITFLDDDDLISPNFLQELLLVSSPTCVGVSNGLSFVDDINKGMEFSITNRFRQAQNVKFTFFKYRFFLSPVAFKLIHRDIIADTRFNTSLKISEDAVFGFTISRNIKSMRCADASAIYYYRSREGSVTHKKHNKGYVLRLALKKSWLFTKIYFSSPFRYNFVFYITRLLATLKYMLVLLTQK